MANALDAKLVRRDLPGAQQTRDFDLVFSDGRVPEPLEVTRFASRPDIETWERLERLGRGIPAPELDGVWHLDVSPPITSQRTETLDVRRIERDVVALLTALEAGGYHRIEYGRIDPAVAAALQGLLDLGVDAGSATAPRQGESPCVVLGSSVGGFTHPDLVADGIEREAHKVDNQNKLTEPPHALRRHLVVVFDVSSGSAFIAAYQGAKGRLPQLPHPITTAWACASESLLATTPPRAWELFRVPQRVFDLPEEWLLA